MSFDVRSKASVFPVGTFRDNSEDYEIGLLAEWLRARLQIWLLRFNSGTGLHLLKTLSLRLDA